MTPRPAKLLGVLGHPLGHTMSPAMFAEVLALVSPGSAYVPFDIIPAELERFLSSAEVVGIAGLNVTIPHKQAMCRHLVRRSDEVEAIGATNCVVRNDDGWHGHNTDAVAFYASLVARKQSPSSALVFGSGGAARAAVHALRRLRCSDITVVSRDPAGLAGQPFYAGVVPATYDEDLADRVAQSALVVNATPCGMLPDVDSAPAEGQFVPGQLVYDMVYNPRPTRLLTKAAQAGATPLDGLEMLARQAALSLHIFTGAVVAWEKFYAAAQRAMLQ